MAMNMTTFDFSFVSNYYYYFLLFISLLLIYNLFSKRSTTKNKPPSPPSFPIIGHLYLIMKKPLHEVLIDLSDRYGHVLLLRLGSQSVLTLSSPSSIEECLTKNDMIFANRPRAVVAKHLGYDNKTLEWASYGSDWRNLRRVMNMDIFSYSSLQKTSNIRNEEVQYMLHQLYQRCLSSSSVEIFHEVDLKPVFFEFAFNIIMKIASGKRSYNGSKKWSFDRLISESFLPERLIHTVDLFPVLRWIGYQSTEKKLKQGRKNKDAFLDELIQEYLDTSSSDERKDEHKPLIGVLMSLQQGSPKLYSHEVVKGIIGTMFSGGIGTSVDTMVAAMSLLVKHPEALAKLRDEIDFHVEEGRFISDSDLPKLPYLQCVIQESLRLHPAVTIPLPHLLSQDCTVAGYDIPRGTWLSINIWGVLRDPKWWDEPTKFIPERFDRVTAIKEGKMDGFHWIPFGAGRRGCPASGMAFRAISLAIGGLVQCLEWKRVDHDDEVIEEVDEPSPRAVCRPRLVKKDILSQI
ncbi:hypothetical protein MKW98_015103 [Papaver atlanticum]|uniref:Cytochrome P450 n=1 Tax=Papaver atlanticum TaxID=357466 RepID=A0AAD4S729_9MAGN|nr:hypothetical protein MKW98_015103 [Papaver atlanticum]